MRKHIADCKEYIVVLYHQGRRTPMESYTKSIDAWRRKESIEAKHTNAIVGVLAKEYALILEKDGELAWGKSL